MKKLLSFWPALIILATIASTAIGIDARYAKDVELAMVRTDFDQYKLQQTRDDVQRRIYDAEDRKVKPQSADAKAMLDDRLRELKDQLRKLDEKITK